MAQFGLILCGVDFSERSREAFRVACSLAQESKTSMYVLHVVEPMVLAGELGMAMPVPDYVTPAEHDQELLARLRDEYAPNHPLDVEYRVRTGTPSEEIVRTAADIGADMIALGTHGRTGLRRLLAGSVAESVLRRASCPVLALSVPEVPHPAGPIQQILHPTDFSASSAAALRVARALARDQGARLTLLHVIQIEVIHGVVPTAVNPQAERDWAERMAEWAEGPDLKYPVETRVVEGLGTAEILQTAGELGCDLIVMGTHGRTGLGRLLMGSIAEAVLRGAHCPVLTVKAATPQTPSVTRPASAAQATPAGQAGKPVINR
jgi:nucleotide-binding universal stress UspA family protein